MPELLQGTDPSTNVSTAQSLQTNTGLVHSSDGPLGSDTEQNKFFDFEVSKIHLQRLIQDWHTEVEDTEVRRKTRDIELDTEGLRQKGDLDEDETLIPVRVIDKNITREQPPYINYLKNSRRLCTFRSLDNPSQDPQQIEQEFTRGMTYTGWEVPHFKCLDGTQTHGWDSVEVVYDADKPLKVAIEHIGHDNLFFPRSIKDFQQASRVCRAYDITILVLKEWVRTFGFDATQVDKICQTRRETQKEGEAVRIYKLYFKKEGVVFVAWFCLTDGCDNWLKTPSKLFLGIREKAAAPVIQLFDNTQQSIDPFQDSDIHQYPIFILPYRESEKPKVVDHKGRCFLDEAKQEAQTAILSGFINGLTRASNVYASPKQDTGNGGSLKEIQDVKLCGGRILSNPIEFWHPDYPDPMVLRSLQYMDDSNSEETNQINFAANNREDSRKTAKEITSSEQQQQLLNSVQLTLFSTHIRAVYSFAWLIVQSQALQNKIKFLLIPSQQPVTGLNGAPLPNPENPTQPLTTTVWVNDINVISQQWEIRAAGDVDVVQRQEKIMQMKQDWPVIANTVLKDRFLADLVKLEYPDSGEAYAEILKSQDSFNQMTGMVKALATIMMGMMQQHPEMEQELPMQERQQLMSIMQSVAPLIQQQKK